MHNGHTKFPFSYLDHVTLLTLAQARLAHSRTSTCLVIPPAMGLDSVVQLTVLSNWTL
jgi:hypothetical protein